MKLIGESVFNRRADAPFGAARRSLNKLMGKPRSTPLFKQSSIRWNLRSLL